jgi:hypothetical protein
MSSLSDITSSMAFLRWAAVLPCEVNMRTGFSSYLPTREAIFFTWFIDLADAIRPIRPLAATCNGWPDKVRPALLEIIETFDTVAEDWGWGKLAEPEPRRSEYVKERIDRYKESIARPLYESALSIHAAWRRPTDCEPLIFEIANDGVAMGYTATMTPEEGRIRFPRASAAFEATPCLGRKFPVLTVALESRLTAATKIILDAVLEVERLILPAAALKNASIKNESQAVSFTTALLPAQAKEDQITTPKMPTHADAEWFACSKAEVLKAFGKSKTYTGFIDSLVTAGRLEWKVNETPVGYHRILVRFAKEEEHAEKTDTIRRNRSKA